MDSKSNTCVIILAAGNAIRLRPISDKIPKPLININGKTLISRIISNFKEAGFNSFFIVIGYKKEMVKKEVLKENDIEIFFTEQTEPTGMADGISLAINTITHKKKNITNFFITAADIIFPKEELLKMYNLHKYSDVVLSLLKSSDIKIARGHGNVKISKDSDLESEFNANQGLKIIDIIEKPKPNQIMSDYYSLPLYLTNQEIIHLLKDLEISERGEKEFQNVLKNALAINLDIRGIRIISHCITYDNIGKFHLTTLRDIIKMNKRFLIRSNLNPYRWKKLKFLEPIKIGNKNVIGDNVSIGPYVITGNLCSLGDFCQISNSILYDNVSLGKSCSLEWCIIDDHVSLPEKYCAKNCFITKKSKKDIEIINF